MATESRAYDHSLAAVEEDSLLEKYLWQEPQVYQFFQAVRLLERFYPDRQPVGQFVHPGNEVVRFGASLSLAFPASEIQSLERTDGRRVRLVANFMGLSGSMGYLPNWYTQLVAEQVRSGAEAIRDFLDIFNHRFISLFYRAWERYRFPVPYELGESDRLSQIVCHLVGMGTEGLQAPTPLEEDSFIFYAGLLGHRPHSAEALRLLLEDYFEVPVEIEQFLGDWFPLDSANVAQPGEREGPSEELGGGMVLGDAAYDQQARARVRLGPLSLEQYRSFLPGQPDYRALQAWTRYFGNDEIDFDVQLVLRRDQVPKLELSERRTESLQLGWITWVNMKPVSCDPGDTILPL